VSRLRPTARSGPCGAGRRGWRGPHGCSSADESRGSGCDAGGWAERCACSREDSHIFLANGWLCTTDLPRRGQQTAVAGAQRPANGTGPYQPGQTVRPRRPAGAAESAPVCPADTPEPTRKAAPWVAWGPSRLLASRSTIPPSPSPRVTKSKRSEPGSPTRPCRGARSGPGTVHPSMHKVWISVWNSYGVAVPQRTTRRAAAACDPLRMVRTRSPVAGHARSAAEYE
jgi:hypothetical protein